MDCGVRADCSATTVINQKLGIAGGSEGTCKCEIDGCTTPVRAIADIGPAVIINISKQSAGGKVSRAHIDLRIAADCSASGSHEVAVGHSEEHCARRADVLRGQHVNYGTTADGAAAVGVD